MKRKSKTAYLPIGVMVILLGMVFFLTSKIWLPSGDGLVEPTKEGEVLQDGNMSVTLCRWIYSPSQNLMEVEVEITDTADVGEIEYRFAAVSRVKGRQDTACVASGEGIAVIRIRDIPSRWSEMALYIADANGQMVTAYENAQNVRNVESIGERSVGEYLADHYRSNITGYEEQIKALDAGSDDCRELISDYETEIDRTLEAQKYETESEKRDSDNLINAYRASVGSLKRQIESNDAEKAELLEKIRMAEKKISDIEENDAKL